MGDVEREMSKKELQKSPLSIYAPQEKRRVPAPPDLGITWPHPIFMAKMAAYEIWAAELDLKGVFNLSPYGWSHVGTINSASEDTYIVKDLGSLD